MMELSALASRFALHGAVTEVRPLGEGFINDTYCVFVDGASQPAYILQRKNHLVFPNVPAMMDNIVAVTRHIKGKVADPERGTLTVVPALDGRWYVQDEAGNFWAVCTSTSATSLSICLRVASKSVTFTAFTIASEKGSKPQPFSL